MIEKADNIWERLELLRSHLNEEFVPIKSEEFTKGWNAACVHFTERLESILRNYPRSDTGPASKEPK